jgi:hypothetical protein
MSSAWENWKNNIGETRPWHLLDPDAILDDAEKIKTRLDICQSCPKFVKLTSQCKECGCIMKLKTKLINASCPLNKW